MVQLLRVAMLALPLSLPLSDKTVILIGEGEWRTRKHRLIAATPAQILCYGDKDEQDFPSDDALSSAALVIVAFEDRKKAEQAVSRLKNSPHFRAILNVVDYPDLSDVHVPAIIDRGPISVGIGSGGVAPVLARRIRAAIEAALPASLASLAQFSKTISPILREALPNVDERRRVWEAILDGSIGSLASDGDHEGAHKALSALLSQPTPHVGEVWLVGAGPGDPELLTLKALKVLNDADVIIYDRLVSDEVLALSRRDATRIFVGKERAHHTLSQEDITALIIQEAKAGHRVVRLKGGDPFVFGRGGEEVEGVKAAGIAVNIIPGISSAQAAAAQSGYPLTHRDHANSLCLITGHARMDNDQIIDAPDHEWQALSGKAQTLVVYMGLHTAAYLSQKLIEVGKAPDTPVLIGENVSRKNARYLICRLSNLAQAITDNEVKGPAILIIGSVITGEDA